MSLPAPSLTSASVPGSVARDVTPFIYKPRSCSCCRVSPQYQNNVDGWHLGCSKNMVRPHEQLVNPFQVSSKPASEERLRPSHLKSIEISCCWWGNGVEEFLSWGCQSPQRLHYYTDPWFWGHGIMSQVKNHWWIRGRTGRLWFLRRESPIWPRIVTGLSIFERTAFHTCHRH